MNQGFRCFSQYLYVLQPSEVEQRIINKHRILSNSFSSGFQFISLWIQGNPHGFEIYYQKLIVQFLFHQETIVCSFFRLLRHQNQNLTQRNPWTQRKEDLVWAKGRRGCAKGREGWAGWKEGRAIIRERGRAMGLSACV